MSLTNSSFIIMEKIGTKKIEVSNKHFENFDVYPCNCKVGDTVWFDDGLPDENGVITNHIYMHGKVTEIEPDKWWVYDDGEKEIGYVTVKVEDDQWYEGQNFSVPFKNIIYEEPVELIMANAQELLDSCKKFEAEMSEMDRHIEFLQNEYKTNKKYFRQEPGRCTVEDVIKTVFEFAWQASKNYHLNNK